MLLDEVDKELEKRGFAFARYADDCNVYVSSKRAGEDVLELLRRLFAGLRLRIDEAKSAVARPWERKFLGYCFWAAPGKEVRLKVASKAIERMKERVRELTPRGGRAVEHIVGRLAAFLRGWKACFRLAQTPKAFRELDKWVRHRLRVVRLKHWKRGRTAYAALVKLGAAQDVARQVAGNTRRWTHNSAILLHTVLDIAYFDRLGLPRLA